jgi:hypothetical protein
LELEQSTPVICGAGILYELLALSTASVTVEKIGVTKDD